MADALTNTTGGDNWQGLLAETHAALAALRVEELEDLSARAGRLRDAAGLKPWERDGVVLRQRLLGDLLLATDSNLRVLRRLRDRSGGGGEGNARWVL
jgi:hypothetical protein